jgi:hypothetical protein
MSDPDDTGLIDPDPRVRCYARIRHVLAEGYGRYYNKHPEKIHEPEALESLKQILRVNQRLVKILDDFVILDPDHHRRSGDV